MQAATHHSVCFTYHPVCSRLASPEVGARHDLRAAYIWSSEEAASVAAARERVLAKAEAALGRIRNGLGGRYYKTRKQADARVAQILTGQAAGLITVRTGTKAGKPWITWARNAAAIADASRLDGLYALATNLPDPGDGTPLTALDVLKTYKDQWIAGQRHRDLKQTLKVRPVFLHNDDRIEALIAVIGIALLIFGLIEAGLRAALGPDVPLPGILPEGRAAKPTARAALAAFDGSASMVRDLIGTVNSQKAQMGVLISMADPSRGVIDAVNHGGTYTWPVNGQVYPRVQVITVADLLSHKRPHMPPPILPYVQATKAGQSAPEQMTLDGGI